MCPCYISKTNSNCEKKNNSVNNYMNSNEEKEG